MATLHFPTRWLDHTVDTSMSHAAAGVHNTSTFDDGEADTFSDDMPSPIVEIELDQEDVMEEEMEEEAAPVKEDEPLSTDGSKGATVRRPAPAFTRTAFVRATSSDAWFLSNSYRRNFASRKLGRDILRGTSAKRISQRLRPLDGACLPHLAQIANELTGSYAYPSRTPHSQLALSLHMQTDRISMLLTQLFHDSHLLLYGVGDKVQILRTIIERATKEYSSAGVLIQGTTGRVWQPDKVLDAIEQALGMSTVVWPIPPEPASGKLSRAMQRVRRIAEFLAYAANGSSEPLPQRLVLGLVSFDSPLFLSTRLQPLMHALAQCERVHIVASVSHVNAGLLFDGMHGMFGHGVAGQAEVPLSRMLGEDAPVRSLRAPWLWHATSTYIPPIAELVQARGAAAGVPALSGLAALKLPAAVDLAGGRARAAPGASIATAVAQPISETAAIQVLSTITSRARSLFSQLAALQLVEMSTLNDESTPARIPYSSLVREALREFVASSDEGVRQLLGEMVDHGLVIVTRGAATVTSSHAIAVGDELFIPLPVPALEQVLAQVA
ncbi:origin recognition complex subunit 2 [Malassezia pachydermatis]|uniref:Origin recognition complex subunit 2 n=1 Tax=Malassezia pachydermatis TaxID=77020 RepID=A0A0M8MRP8_9BASI|nr:origin recognition complex subunit 2 [Malassezia pachydermatis]KOS12984.1 origin recognition complex subunit 2 [Malassezia pachydermatis]